MKKFLICCMGATLIALQVFAYGCGNGKIKLYFDGGGDGGVFNSTPSMEVSSANPYPYNTLEVLAREWNEKNDKYEIVINKQSLQCNRTAIVPLLSAAQAPDMLFQTANVVPEDYANGWYQDMTEYFASPNPYIEGNEKWSDIYNAAEIAATKAPDGKYYYTPLDKGPLGIMYNREIFAEAGIAKEPETFSELISAMDKIREKRPDVIPYLPVNPLNWYATVLETAVFAGEIDTLDADGDKVVSMPEFVAAYKSGAWAPDNETSREYARIIGQLASYFPEGYDVMDVMKNFAEGKVCMIEGLGVYMRQMNGDARREFEMGIFALPDLDRAASACGGTSVAGGIRGYSTNYFITNAAVEKGKGAVDACADFLMYISAPEQNERLINDLGITVPLDPDTQPVALFRGLADVYKSDLASGAALTYDAVNSINRLGMPYFDTFRAAFINYCNGTIDADTFLTRLAVKVKQVIK